MNVPNIPLTQEHINWIMTYLNTTFPNANLQYLERFIDSNPIICGSFYQKWDFLPLCISQFVKIARGMGWGSDLEALLKKVPMVDEKLKEYSQLLVPSEFPSYISLQRNPFDTALVRLNNLQREERTQRTA